MPAITILICDDDKKSILNLKKLLLKYQSCREVSLKILTIHHPEELFAVNDYDILFLDIFFGGTQLGLDYIKSLRKAGITAQVVFVSSLASYGISKVGFEENITDYLTKPFQIDEIVHVMDRMMSVINRNSAQQPRLRVKYQGETNVILCADIFYIESIARKRYIHLFNNIITTRDALSQLYEALPNELFGYTHNAYVVNTSYVDYIKKDLIILTNGESVPISRTFKKSFLELLDRQMTKELNHV